MFKIATLSIIYYLSQRDKIFFQKKHWSYEELTLSKNSIFTNSQLNTIISEHLPDGYRVKGGVINVLLEAGASSVSVSVEKIPRS